MAIDTYLNLVTSQYRDSPNFINWLTTALQKGEDITELLSQFESKFDIDTAVGKQLDTLGELIGRSRKLTFQPSNGVSPILDDEPYRTVLKAKIAINQWDGTIPGVYEYWNVLFPQLYLEIYDNQDMTMDIIVVGLSSTLLQQLLQNGYLTPKPEGVRVNYITVNRPIFAYDMDTTAMKGYDQSYWQGGGIRLDANVFGYGSSNELIGGYGGAWS
ncbi:hypothetical protein SOV_04880 [Sporomusa ovata DSM 2662]|uniref:Putative bacteriophage protein n=1 Tax=Sporomusa ovata TaxID=2378 RepID=A0A0U1KW84_9FIRM|nr:DUF2612 domain-containing protein [Sporomusa ovata]EQB28158.1 hypothetical protein SOV_2c10810 [Sporomusa ovata DSM 2662]CQR71692.1 Putative bacteriophage protein [Sporomusa ovata]